MSKDKNSKENIQTESIQVVVNGGLFVNTVDVNRLILPLEMRWLPKEDITTYELAKCLPYLLRHNTMPYEIDKTEKHFRHFDIIDPNR